MPKQQIQKWFSTLEPVRFYYAENGMLFSEQVMTLFFISLK